MARSKRYISLSSLSTRNGKVFAVIPARFGSTRFPGKPLVIIGDKTMIRWTYESASKSKNLDEVIVATDDERILREVESWGGNVVMTRSDHPTGTDRIIEVVNHLGSRIRIEEDIILNIQGDEPGIEEELIDGVVSLKRSNPHWVVTTSATAFTHEEALDPNRIKVVFDKNYRALYFSRSVIPYAQKADSPLLARDSQSKQPVYYRHIGIYCFNADFLLEFNKLPASSWETLESLEQLRILQSGYEIGIHISPRATLSIDHPNDVGMVEADLRSRGLLK